MLTSFVLFANLVNAQDQLFKKDNSKLLIKIVEVNPDEIKYRAFDNQDGPTYSESKANVSMIIYEDGSHETFTDNNTSAASQISPPQAASNVRYNDVFSMTESDSLWYYKYSNNISMNFLSFFNNEIALVYQREFFKEHYNIIIPVAFGVERPNVTHAVYFNTSRTIYDNKPLYQLNNKIFDIGFGINYYPTLTSEFNYYIGPMLRYMQYNGTQNYDYVTNPLSLTYKALSKNSIMVRYAMGITNGVVYRMRSRLTASAYATMGFKKDVISDREKIKHPVTGEAINPIPRPVSFYFWCGVNVGFNF